MSGRAPGALGRLLIAGLAAFPVLFAPDTAFACSCTAPPPPEEALAEATAVFSGVVSQIEEERAGGGWLTIRFIAEETWKGLAPGEAAVRTRASDGLCGYRFEEGNRYIVYAEAESDGGLTVSLCSRTAPISRAADDLDALGMGLTLRDLGLDGPDLNEPRPFPLRTGLLAGAFVLSVFLLGGAVVLWRRDPDAGRDNNPPPPP